MALDYCVNMTQLILQNQISRAVIAHTYAKPEVLGILALVQRLMPPPFTCIMLVWKQKSDSLNLNCCKMIATYILIQVSKQVYIFVISMSRFYNILNCLPSTMLFNLLCYLEIITNQCNNTKIFVYYLHSILWLCPLGVFYRCTLGIQQHHCV